MAPVPTFSRAPRVWKKKHSNTSCLETFTFKHRLSSSWKRSLRYICALKTFSLDFSLKSCFLLWHFCPHANWYLAQLQSSWWSFEQNQQVIKRITSLLRHWVWLSCWAAATLRWWTGPGSGGSLDSAWVIAVMTVASDFPGCWWSAKTIAFNFWGRNCHQKFSSQIYTFIGQLWWWWARQNPNTSFETILIILMNKIINEIMSVINLVSVTETEGQ